MSTLWFIFAVCIWSACCYFPMSSNMFSISIEDKLSSCNICYRVLDNIEKDLLTKSPEMSEMVRPGKKYDSMGRMGQRYEQTIHYIFSEKQVCFNLDIFQYLLSQMRLCIWYLGD